MRIANITGSPGDVTVSIQGTYAGLPDGTDLATAEDVTNPGIGWHEWVFLSPCEVDAGVKYAIVVRAPDGDYDENKYISISYNPNTCYANGRALTSWDGGVYWSTDNDDLSFEIWGEQLEYFVDSANCPGPGSGMPDDPFCKIQDAINAATGTTIIVRDGTYTEDLVVNKANLTLRSENGKDSTTIQLVDGVGIDIQGGADNFVLGGAEYQGFTILSSVGGASTTFCIQLVNAPSGVTISHNTINTTGDASMGISIGIDGATDLAINNNEFIGDSDDGAIWGPNVVDVTVSDNEFTGNGAYAIQFSGITASSPSVISGNNITNYTGSGAIVISNGGGTSNLEISHNNISNCSYGIRLVEYYYYAPEGIPGDMEYLNIYGNVIMGNTIHGVRIHASNYILANTFAIHFNHFINNANEDTGLANQNTQWVHAENNWWGCPEGPGNPGCDTVSGNVYYYPWLGAPLVLPAVHFEALESGNDQVVDASVEADTIVTLNVSSQESETDIYIAKYESEPFPPQTFESEPLGKYIDIYLTTPKAVIWPIYVEMSYEDEEAAGFEKESLGLYYYQPEFSFIRCSNTGVDTENNIIWAYVYEDEAEYGSKTPFAPGGELSPPQPSQPPAPEGEAVGGDVYSTNKSAILAPWLALAIAIIAVGVFLIRRRVHSVK